MPYVVSVSVSSKFQFIGKKNLDKPSLAQLDPLKHSAVVRGQVMILAAVPGYRDCFWIKRNCCKLVIKMYGTFIFSMDPMFLFFFIFRRIFFMPFAGLFSLILKLC